MSPFVTPEAPFVTPGTPFVTHETFETLFLAPFQEAKAEDKPEKKGKRKKLPTLAAMANVRTQVLAEIRRLLLNPASVETTRTVTAQDGGVKAENASGVPPKVTSLILSHLQEGKSLQGPQVRKLGSAGFHSSSLIVERRLDRRFLIGNLEFRHRLHHDTPSDHHRLRLSFPKPLLMAFSPLGRQRMMLSAAYQRLCRFLAGKM
jgi:hypothetical protein